MLKGMKRTLTAICIVMLFTAQAPRPDQKAPARNVQNRAAGQLQRQAPAARPAARQPAAQVRIQAGPQARPQVARNDQNRPVVQFHREPAAPAASRPEAGRQQWTETRVYAQPQAVPAVNNNRLFNRHHSDHWQPRYNFFDNGYHFYPYVNIATLVDLTTTSVQVPFNGQTYLYDQGTFYLQDESGQYVAVPPPVGVIVNVLPDRARQIDVNGQIYFRYKGVFYVQVEQGFEVVGPVEPVSAEA